MIVSAVLAALVAISGQQSFAAAQAASLALPAAPTAPAAAEPHSNSAVNANQQALAAASFLAPDASGSVNSAGAAEPSQPKEAKPAAPIGSNPGSGLARLPGHVLSVLADSASVAPVYEFGKSPAGQGEHAPMTLTLTLNRDDQAGFDRYMAEVYDPKSRSFRDFLRPAQLATRFGPSRKSYAAVLQYLQGKGLQLVEGSPNRLTMSVRGERAQIERAFAVHIGEYQIGDRRFHANDSDPAVPTALAPHIAAISGFSDLAQPKHAVVALAVAYACVEFALYLNTLANDAGFLRNSYQFCINSIVFSYGLPHLPGGSGASQSSRSTALSAGIQPQASADGAGQTIGLLEFDNYKTSDVSDYLALTEAPASNIDNLTAVPVNGGAAIGAAEDEVLLDIDTVMAAAPGAKVVVYDAPFDGTATSYQAVFNAMINGGVSVISNSWASCEDQVSQSDAQSIDQILQTAAASGISVFNGAGDQGSTCLDGSANTASVPADSPSATAVGGTSLTLAPGETYGSETWWNGSQSVPQTGQGGFGVSKYFSRPSYQNGLNAAAGRSIPDVAASADPASGIPICQADAGGCPTGALYGGTSFSAPLWASMAALLNQSVGKNLGAFNAAAYPLASSAGFHSAASMGSDFSHVGLGSPNLDALSLLLAGQTVGAVSPTASTVASWIGSATAGVSSGSVPADGSTKVYEVVTLLDANGNAVPGKTISLAASGGSAVITASNVVTTTSNGTAIFEVTDLSPETVTFTATDTTDSIVVGATSTVAFGVPPAASASISANPPTVANDGASAATITVTLKDSLGRATPGKTVTVADANAHAVITGPASGQTDSNGQIQFTATDQVAETVTFTAVDVSDGNLPVPGSGAVNYSGTTNAACGLGVTPVAGSGYAITPFITGFPAATTFFYQNVNYGCPGANNPAFTSSGTVLVSDFLTGSIYQLPASGGTASSSTILSSGNPALGGLVHGKDGSVYVSTGSRPGSVEQIDPDTGAILRVVATGFTCPAGLSVDPLSGDLFVDDQCTGAGYDDPSIYRIMDPTSATPSVVVYATLPRTPNGGMAFAPDGTLYVVSGYYYTPNAQVEMVSPTSSATVTVTDVIGITSDYGIAIGETDASGAATSLIVNEPSGTLSEEPIADPGTPNILAPSSPGVGVTGPDGCLYSAGYDTIYKLTKADSSCNFAPTSAAPALSLTPTAVSPNPAQGSAQTFTATLHNVASLAGVPVIFQVTGANAQIKLVNSDASGNAVFSYTAVRSGSDTVTATATIAGSGSTSAQTAARMHGLTPQVHTAAAAVVRTSAQPAGAAAAAANAGRAVPSGTRSTPLPAPQAIAPHVLSPAAKADDTAATQTLISNTVDIDWSAGMHASELSLNPSPTSGAVGQPLTVIASLADISAAPAVVAAGQSVSFSLEGGSCSAVTNAQGLASCAITPATSGSTTLSASFGGSSDLSASSAAIGVSLMTIESTPPPPAPTVSIAVSPTSISLGQSATLSWTSANATSCAASGGWSGPEATSGSQVVTPSAAGNTSYTLSCSGDGGSAAASATLAVATSLPPVVVKTGGGAFGWPLSLLLALAGLVRRRGPILRKLAVCLSALAAGFGVASAHADGGVLDSVYLGARGGATKTYLDPALINQTLASEGYSVTASADRASVSGGAYIGYQLAPFMAAEFSYTHHDSTLLQLSGQEPPNLSPLLLDAAKATHGFGNTYAFSVSTHGEVFPHVVIDPRAGFFIWQSKVKAEAGGQSESATHSGGGVTLGFGVAYRIWRGLSLGGGIDYFRSLSNGDNMEVYGGSIEWALGGK